MNIEQRVVNFANLLLDNKITIREVAKLTGYSKSTIHKDLQDKLVHINIELYDKVKKLLDYNKQIRHIRGGMSTKFKYTNN